MASNNSQGAQLGLRSSNIAGVGGSIGPNSNLQALIHENSLRDTASQDRALDIPANRSHPRDNLAWIERVFRSLAAGHWSSRVRGSASKKEDKKLLPYTSCKYSEGSPAILPGSSRIRGCVSAENRAWEVQAFDLCKIELCFSRSSLFVFKMDSGTLSSLLKIPWSIKNKTRMFSGPARSAQLRM
ncbi:hypothetical protein Ancab_028400 [Ancistrocladus abbreviatus]